MLVLITSMLVGPVTALCIPGVGTPAVGTPAIGARFRAATTSLDASFTDPDGFWSVRYPKSWTRSKAGSEQQFLRDRGATVGFAVSVQIKTVSPVALVDDVSALLRDRRDGYEDVDRGDAVIDGLPAAWVEHRYVLDGRRYAGMLVGVVRNRVGVLLVAWAPEDQLESVQPLFTAFVDSLQVTRFDASPDYATWTAKRSTHFIYRYLPGTYVASDIKAIAKHHEAAYAAITQTLGVSIGQDISMYFYPSDEALYRATARDAGFAINPAREVHTIWVSATEHQSLGHEMTHVIASATIGEPTEALLGEGIAVCLDQATPSPRARAAALRSDDRLVPVADLLGDSFFDVDAAVRYPESGAIACWLLEQYGVAKFKQLYVAKDFTAALKSIHRLDVATLQQKWLASLSAEANTRRR